MPITLVSTIGAADANTYNDAAALTAVASTMLPRQTVFESANDDDVARAAVTATQLLDHMQYLGEPAGATQALAWPRYPVRKPNGRDYYLTTEIPQNVLLAHAKLTFYLLEQAEAGVDPFAVSENAGLTSIDFGSELSMTFEAGSTSVTAGQRFVGTVIRPLLGALVYANQPRVIR